MITVRQAAAMNRQQRGLYLERVEGLLAKNRRNFDALLSGAALHYTNQNLPACADMLSRAHAVKKNDGMVLAWLSIVLADSQQIKQALKTSEKLVRLSPNAPNSWDVRGKVLDQAGKPAEALAAFDKVRKLAGPNPELEMQIANSHFYMGELEAAAEAYLRVQEMEPTHAMALYGYSTVHKFAPEESEKYIEKVDAALPANSAKPDYYTSALHYTAAKVHMDNERFDDAFAAYQKANDMRRPENTDALSRPFDAARQAFPAGFFSDKTEWGDRFASPVFILGMPRSGTTLVESIAAAHKSVTAGGEMPFMDAIAMGLGSNEEPATYSNSISGLSRRDVANLAGQYLSEARSMAGTSGRFTDKMPHNFLNIGLIFYLFPKAKIIHCLRHPLDNCVSIYTNAMTPVHNYYKSDLSTLGEYYKMYEDIMRYWHDVFPGRILDVYYEDVISNTELNSKRIMEYLNLSFDDNIMKRETAQQAVRTLSAWQVRQPIYQTAYGRWRKFESHIGPLREQLEERVRSYEEQLQSLAKTGTEA